MQGNMNSRTRATSPIKYLIPFASASEPPRFIAELALK